MAKQKCNDEAIEYATVLKRRGVSNKDICVALCIDESTFYKWLKNPKTQQQRQFFKSIKKAEVEYKADLLDAIYSKATDQENITWQAAAWLLERKYPGEFAKVSRMEIKEQEKQDKAEADNISREMLKRQLSQETDEELLAHIAEFVDKAEKHPEIIQTSEDEKTLRGAKNMLSIHER